MIAFNHKLHTTTSIIAWHYFYIRYNLPLWSLLPFIFGGLFPDTDTPYSKLGKLIPFWLIFKHRGFMHTPGAMLIIYAFGRYFHYMSVNAREQILLSLYMFLGGYVLHMILDTCTHSGIKWLWPIYKKPFSLHLCRTGNAEEGAAFLLSILYISVKILGFKMT